MLQHMSSRSSLDPQRITGKCLKITLAGDLVWLTYCGCTFVGEDPESKPVHMIWYELQTRVRQKASLVSKKNLKTLLHDVPSIKWGELGEWGIGGDRQLQHLGYQE